MTKGVLFPSLAVAIISSCSLSLLILLSTVSAQAGPWDAALHLFPQSLMDKYNAKCLDGSPPGLFFRKASSNSAATKWKIHIQGGGWCTSLGDCYSRTQTLLGSSKTWNPWLSNYWLPEGAGFYGIMDANATSTNPFGEWNFVWLAYCDGSSFTSNAVNPLIYKNTPLYFRGAAILDGQLDLMETLGKFLSESTEVIVSGTSAGGLATYLQSEYIKSRITTPSGARVVSLPDAGFFLDHARFNSTVHSWYNTVANAILPTLWNATLRGNAGTTCLEQLNPKGLAAKCYFAQYLYPYMTMIDGIFVLQSNFDKANIGIVYGVTCDLYKNCNATEKQGIISYAQDLLNTIQMVQAHFPKRDSAFVTTCYQHEESCRARDWYGIIIGGQSANNTFYNWYKSGNGENSGRVDVPWPGDTSCAPQGFDHGAC